MRDNSEAIAFQIGQRVMLVEFGSGSSLKTRILLDALDNPSAYVPVDISEEHLLRTAEILRSAYPELEVVPVVADFTEPFELPSSATGVSHVALYFPGSTIGNFTPVEAGQLLGQMRERLGPQGGLLIGVDLQKDVDTLEAAYNDAAGVTERFSKNILARINRELGGNFNLDQFQHVAIYNDKEHRIEISLRSRRDQIVSIGDKEFQLADNEMIRTEYSHKYTVEGFAEFAAQFGFVLHEYWTDKNKYFAVLHLVNEKGQ